jgi:hypothetical protein
MSYTRKVGDACAHLKAEALDWGARYLTDTEIDALRLCYLHRNNPYGTQIRECPNVGGFSVTVFNKFSTTISIDRS